MYYLGTVVAAGPVVRRLPFLWVVATTPLPIAGEHHRDVGVLYSHSATTDGAPALISCGPTSCPPGVSILYFSVCGRPPAPRNIHTYIVSNLPQVPSVLPIIIFLNKIISYDTKINIRKKLRLLLKGVYITADDIRGIIDISYRACPSRWDRVCL